MTIKEACLKIMNENVFDKPVRQVDIVKEVSRLTGRSYESCRCNTFRNPNAIPEIWMNYKKVVHEGNVCYIRGTSSYRQDYVKPSQYYTMLSFLNNSDKIYTLSGTQSLCTSVLDNNKTISVDKSPHSNASVKKDILTIVDNGSYNLDFEGILTKRKVEYINKLSKKCDSILLTFMRSKNDHLLNVIDMKIINRHDYIGKSNRRMSIVLLTP